jgi:hypothetical protein
MHILLIMHGYHNTQFISWRQVGSIQQIFLTDQYSVYIVAYIQVSDHNGTGVRQY